LGTEIAGFRIESVLGRGGMSVVYLAEQVRLGRKVALKLLVPQVIAMDHSFRDRFLQESQLAAHLDHPNIIPIFDAGEEDDCLYIAMRYVDGRDLGQTLQQEGPLSLGRTLFILEQVASALDTAHEHGLVHRDVKPANILLVGDTDRVYLTDFGVAKPTTSAGLTRTGFFIGTPDYSAPEQIEGRDVDARTDVYALGAVLYSCLTGTAPYARDTEVAVLQAHMLEPPPKLSDARRDLPRALDRVVTTAMAKVRDERYPACGDLLIAARAASLDRPVSFPSAEPTIITTPAATGPTETLSATEAVGATEPLGAPDVVAATEAARVAEGADLPETTLAPEPVAATVAASAAATSTAPAGPTETAPAVPPPPGPTTAEPPGRRPGKRRTWMLVGILAAGIIALAAILAVVLIGNDGGSSSASTNGTSFTVAMKSSAEVPTSTASSSSGTAKVTINDTKVCWDFTLSGVDNPDAAHIHRGGPNVSGPVVVPLGDGYNQKGCTDAPAATTQAILANPAGYYVNVHSVQFPDGAVRGQLQGSTGTGGQTGTKAVGLAGVVPSPIFKNCTVQAKPAAGAVETANCVPGTGGPFYPDNLQLSIYPNADSLAAAYTAQRKDADVGTNFGRCDGSSWLGEGPWFHAPEAAGQPGKRGGERFCYFDGNVAVIVWTHGKFGQATHDNFLAIAREGGSDHPSLFSWWRFWHHRIGKCQQEGCVASA
jgi:predicted Ser/Thr protein kinase